MDSNVYWAGALLFSKTGWSVGEKTERQGNSGSVGGIDIKCRALTRRSGPDFHGTWCRGVMNGGIRKWNCQQSGRRGWQNSREALIQNQKLQTNEQDSNRQKEMLTIFRGSAELQVWRSRCLVERISVMLLEKCRVKITYWRRNRLTGTKLRIERKLYLNALTKLTRSGDLNGTWGKREIFVKNVREPCFVKSNSRSHRWSRKENRHCL